MPSFFSDDDRCGNDLNDMMNQAPGALKQGFALGYLCMLPFLVLCKIIEGVGNASQARAEAGQQQRNVPPPQPEPPPYSRAQSPPPPPPPPPPKADPLDKFRHILGVSATADKEAIKKRYRFLSHLCHPDKVADHLKEQAAEEFKKISEAYKVLYAVAPEGSSRPRPQARKPEPQRTPPRTAEPKREPERPKQARQEPPKPSAKPKETTQPAAAAKKNGERVWPSIKLPPDIDRPKYF